MEPWLQPALRRRGDAGRRPLGDRGAGGALAGADGGRRAGAGRGGRRAGARGAGAGRLRQGQQRRRRAGRRPVPARDRLRGRGAAALAGGGAERRCRGEPGALPAEQLDGDLGSRWPAPARSSTRSSAPASPATPREPAAAAIAAINRCGAPVVACDIASGVDASSGEVAGAAVEADLTVSFHAAKLGHRIAPGKWHTGELRVAPIGIPDGAPLAARRRHDRRRRCSTWRRAAARARPSSAPAR